MAKYLVTITVEVDVPDVDTYDRKCYERTAVEDHSWTTSMDGDVPETDVAKSMVLDYLNRGLYCTATNYVNVESDTYTAVKL